MSLKRFFSCFKVPAIPIHDSRKNARSVVKRVAKGNLLLQQGAYSTAEDISALKKRLSVIVYD